MATENAARNRAMKLSGEALAHAALSISDSRGPLIPLGIAHRSGFFGGKKVLMRYIYPGPQQIDLALSVSRGRSEALAKLPEFNSSAFVYDGYIKRPEIGEKTDALVVEAHDVAMETPIVIFQPYQPASTGSFKLLGPPVFTQSDHAVAPEFATQLNTWLFEGIRSHRKAGQRWSSWQN